MKIGMILDTPYPSDNRVYQEGNALYKAGHELALFSLGLFSGQDKVEKVSPFTVYRYSSNKAIYKSSAIAYPWPFYKLLVRPKLKHFLDTVQPDVVHVHDMVIAEAVMDEVNGTLPVVLDLHENRPVIMQHYPHMKKWLSQILIRKKYWEAAQIRLAKRADKVIVVTAEAKEQLAQEANIDPNKIIVAPNSIALPKNFFTHTNLKESTDQINLLYIGDTGLRRGLITAIRGVKQTRLKGYNVRLIIVGSSSEDHVLKEEIMSNELGEAVKMEGWQLPENLPAYLAQSHIGISPLHRNLHHDTTFANKLFQYMEAGMPLLVSDSTAQANLVQKENCGLVHREQDPQHFSTQLIKLLESKPLMDKLGANGVKAVKDKYSPAHATKALVEMYEKM